MNATVQFSWFLISYSRFLSPFFYFLISYSCLPFPYSFFLIPFPGILVPQFELVLHQFVISALFTGQFFMGANFNNIPFFNNNNLMSIFDRA